MVIDKIYKFLIFLIFFYSDILAQKPKPYTPTKEMLSLIHSHIQTIEKGWLNNDFSIAISQNLMHPKILDMAGGKEALIENTQLEMQALGNFTIQKVTFENPKDFVIYNQVIYCIVPFKMVMNFEGTSITNQSFLLVFSENEGKNFYILDEAALKNPIIENLFPDIKMAIKLPH
jgi:hypothetical protein